MDESVTKSLQNVDLLCFSSQHYFIISIIALGFGTNMLGITICLRQQYNFLGDPIFLLIMAATIACCKVIVQVCVCVSNSSIEAICWDGIWKVVHLQGTMDDVIASKLAIGEGRQEDLEQERQELQAMNDETFRHKFMDKNRPWVLQHLVELITPRSLLGEDVGPDGRPLVNYVRDVYSKLMNAGDGVNRHEGDRSDISSDDDSDEEEKRRKWDHAPLEGNRLLILRIWLQKARKRRVFTNAITAIVEKKKLDHCLVCSRTSQNCEKLTAGLASLEGGFADPLAIDYLIKLFEDSYSPEESDLNLWKAFFKENARYSTVCNICEDAIEKQKDLHRVGAGLQSTRADDISDDESEDDVLFGVDHPVIIAKSSDEGQIMSKWLENARKSIGGEFPRVEVAEKQVKEYLEKQQKSSAKVNDDGGGGAAETKSDQVWGNLELNEKGENMVRLWLEKSRSRAQNGRMDRETNIRKDLQSLLGALDIEDDWYSGELRLEGAALAREGDAINKMGKKREVQMKAQLDALRFDLEVISNGVEEQRSNKKREYEIGLSQLRSHSLSKKEARVLELNKKIDDLQKDQDTKNHNDDGKALQVVQTLLQTEVEEEEERLNHSTNDLRNKFEELSKTLTRELNVTLQSYERDCQVLRNKTQTEHVHNENEWQKKVHIWIGKAERVEASKQNSMNKPLPGAKKMRLEQRKSSKQNVSRSG